MFGTVRNWYLKLYKMSEYVDRIMAMHAEWDKQHVEELKNKSPRYPKWAQLNSHYGDVWCQVEDKTDIEVSCFIKVCSREERFELELLTSVRYLRSSLPVDARIIHTIDGKFYGISKLPIKYK